MSIRVEIILDFNLEIIQTKIYPGFTAIISHKEYTEIRYYLIGSGIWGGLTCIISGCLGMACCGRRLPRCDLQKRKMTLMGLIILSFISSVIAYTLIFIFGFDYFKKGDPCTGFGCNTTFAFTRLFFTLSLLVFVCSIGQAVVSAISLGKIPPRTVIFISFRQQNSLPGSIEPNTHMTMAHESSCSTNIINLRNRQEQSQPLNHLPMTDHENKKEKRLHPTRREKYVYFVQSESLMAIFQDCSSHFK